MNEKDVAFFGTLLNVETKDVEQYAEEGTLGEKVAALNLMDSTQVDTLKTNLTKEVKESHIGELVADAKKGDIPSDLYKVIKGATLEMTEKDLAKEFGVDSYTSVKDLVSKAISKNKGQADDTKMQELTQKITDLQGINTNLVQEKDDALDAARTEFEGKILKRDKNDMLYNVPFDFSDVEDADLEKVTAQRRQIVDSVFDSKYTLAFDGEKVVVKDQAGDIIKDRATMEPVPALDVLKTIPVELGIKLKSPESGGQGGKSSGKGGSTEFKSEEDFFAYCKDKGILPTSAEGIKVWTERRPK